MAEEETHGSDPPKTEFPTGRVKRILKLDEEINKVTSEAVFLVTRSTELFLRFIAEGSAGVAAEKKLRTIKLEDLRDAVKRHQPTSTFLLDSLPLPAASAGDPAGDKPRCRPENDKRAPAGTRRIDQFFTKPVSDSPVQTTGNSLGHILQLMDSVRLPGFDTSAEERDYRLARWVDQ